MSRSRNAESHVGVLVETDDTWGRNVVESICRFGQMSQWTILISPRDSQGRLRIPRIWHGDGVIASLRNRSTIQHLKKLQVPVVDVSDTMKKETWFGRVTTDDRIRAEMAVEHFKSRGMTDFACYAPSIGRYSDARAREFQHRVAATGAECSMYTPADENATGWLTNYAHAQEWLLKLPKPVAVFAGDPHPARQLVELCAMNEIRVPDDVAILSADDDDLLCNVASPQISSIELASHRIGETAAKVLQRLMSGGPVPHRTKKISPLKIRARQSTDVLAIDDPELASALKFIRDHSTETITVADVANHCHVSRRLLEQRFREKLNRSPGKEIRRARLEHVQRLLLDTDETIAKIAFESGFASGASLSQAFQKHFGQSPKTFRESR